MKNKTLFHNLIFNISYQILLIFLPLITTPYVSRVLGPGNSGIYSFTHSVANYFVLFAMLGQMSYGTRSIAFVASDKTQRSKTFWEIYFIQLISSTLVLISYLLYLFLFDLDHLTISILQTLYVLSALFDISWYFQGLSKYRTLVLRNFVVKIISVCLIFILVKKQEDLWKYTTIMAASILVSQIILWFALRNSIEFVFPRLYGCLSHLKSTFLLFFSSIAVSVYKVMDKIMIGMILDYKDVGYYEYAERITNLPMGIVAATGTVMLSKISSEHNNMATNNYSIRCSLKILIPFAILFSFGLYSIGEDFSIIYFGDEFEKTGYLLEYLGFTTIFLTWGNVIRTQYLLPNKADKLITLSVVFGAIINFISNIVLLHLIGAMGAVVGTLVTEFSVAVIVTLYCYSKLEIKDYLFDCIPFIVAGIVMSVVIYWLGHLIHVSAILSLILKSCVATFVYLAIVLLYWISKKDPILSFFSFHLNN